MRVPSRPPFSVQSIPWHTTGYTRPAHYGAVSIALDAPRRGPGSRRRRRLPGRYAPGFTVPSRDAPDGRKEHTVCHPQLSYKEEGSCVKGSVHMVVYCTDVLRKLP
jgi:hypothetical protein